MPTGMGITSLAPLALAHEASKTVSSPSAEHAMALSVEVAEVVEHFQWLT
jgi:hypothetical protein